MPNEETELEECLREENESLRAELGQIYARELRQDAPSLPPLDETERQDRTYCPTCKAFCVLPNHCDNCGGDLVVAPTQELPDHIYARSGGEWNETLNVEAGFTERYTKDQSEGGKTSLLELERSERQQQGLLPCPLRKTYDRLIHIAADIAMMRGFISPYADDNPKTTPQSILHQAGDQEVKMKDWAHEISEIARGLIEPNARVRSDVTQQSVESVWDEVFIAVRSAKDKVGSNAMIHIFNALQSAKAESLAAGVRP